MIHSTAIISEGAELHPSVEVGAFSVILGKVKIDEGTKISNNVTVGFDNGTTVLGKNNQLLPYSAVGGPPQDSSYKGEPVRLEVGDRNIFREFVTVNMGTAKQEGVTKMGSDNMLMSYSHIAHDCILGDRVVIANATQFAGHVTVENDVKVGGGCLINQFVTLGEHAYIAGDAAVNKDVLPFTIAQGKYAVCRATNKIGMERAGFSKDLVESIHKAIRLVVMGDRTTEEAVAKIKEECPPSAQMEHLVQFIMKSNRGIAR